MVFSFLGVLLCLTSHFATLLLDAISLYFETEHILWLICIRAIEVGGTPKRFFEKFVTTLMKTTLQCASPSRHILRPTAG